MLPRRHWLPLLILLFGVVASILAASLLASGDRERSEARFNALATSAASAVDNKIQMHSALLRGAAGLFIASERVTREEFGDFVERLRLNSFHPGVLGIGYAVYAPDRQSIDDQISQSLVLGQRLRFWPEGDRRGYSSILYLEPMNRRNIVALGFDMMSDATRREAMVRAMRTESSAMSGKVLLVQEIDENKQPGFLIYTPVVDLDANGEKNFRGWVYSPLRGFDLFGSLFEGRDFEAVDIAVFDGAPTVENLLFESGPRNAQARHVARVPLELAGRTLTVLVASNESFASSSPLPLSLVVAVGGTLFSVLLAFLVGQRERTMMRIERQVEERTGALRETNRQLREEIDARSAAEAKLHQMQRMESIGQLTGGIAHDFNNMLSVVIGNLDLAQRSAEDRKRVDRLIGQALKGATSAAELTQRLLAFSRRQTLVPSAVDANLLISEMTEMLNRAIGETILLETDLAPNLWTINADSAQLESAILNLAVNARDAMPKGGNLRIRTENKLRGLEEPGEYVLIIVEDDGSGMSPDVIARACEPFFTTKGVGQGTGLGLSQVYGFAQQSGGFLDVESEEGRGTRVTIALPRHIGEASRETPASAAQAAPPRSGETVLVVEDEEDVRAFSAEALSDLGFSVLQAESAERALELLEVNRVDLVFSDMVMPGMNGSEFASVARSRWPETRFLFTTGYTNEEVFRNGESDEGAAILRKPFTVEQLAGKVRETLDR